MNPKQLPPLSRDESKLVARRRRGRNIAMLIVLIALSGLFYAVAMVKLTKPDLAP
ncbi:hypothetical protein [Limobrevibacterium gyesilva]|uniref:Uncharacterized protein n=1 Tax=Limobrevibacterium gyesilva TaxID=2991712 RepID=A0AA42CG12_9PROT|nr:hypothetical protein [Limobrevibacterium gyesilva]MCW3473360.1 hypothetical protein [Limobrevibacterium gyesilva]